MMQDRPEGLVAKSRRKLPGRAEQGTGLPRSRYRKLRPGRGRSTQEVAAHQRARLHRAMIEIVAERGYESVTVRDLAGLAGVSTRTFYEHFSGSDDCFLLTYDLLVRRTARRIAAAYDGEADHRECLRRALAAFADEVQREPASARLMLVEIFAAGPAALERIQRGEAVVGTIIAECLAKAPDRIDLSQTMLSGMVAGVMRVAQAQLLAGDEQVLPELTGELLEWMLNLGSEEAMRLGQRNARLGRVGLDDEERTGSDEPERAAIGDERELILSAAARLAASEGYGRLNPQRIRAAAGVTRRSFETHFGGLDDCFLAALEQRTERALAEAARRGATAQSWSDGVIRTLNSLCLHLARNPTAARVVLVEVFATGADGVRCYARLIDGIAEFIRSTAPPRQRPSRLFAEASAAAVWRIIHHTIASERTERLPHLPAMLSYLVLAPAIGASNAAEAIGRKPLRKEPRGQGEKLVPAANQQLSTDL